MIALPPWLIGLMWHSCPADTSLIWSSSTAVAASSITLWTSWSARCQNTFGMIDIIKREKRHHPKSHRVLTPTVSELPEFLPVKIFLWCIVQSEKISANNLLSFPVMLLKSCLAPERLIHWLWLPPMHGGPLHCSFSLHSSRLFLHSRRYISRIPCTSKQRNPFPSPRECVVPHWAKRWGQVAFIQFSGLNEKSKQTGFDK